MVHYRLQYTDPDGSTYLAERYSTRKLAEAAAEVDRQYGDSVTVVAVPGCYLGPQTYGAVGTVDGIPVTELD